MSLDRITRTRIVTVLVLFLVLASGFALGVATDREVRGRALTRGELEVSGSRERGGGDPRRSSATPDSARRRPLLVEQVGLTEAQKLQVDSVVAFYRVKMRNLHESTNEAYWRGYREIVEETRGAMRAVLTEAQRAAYDSLLVEMDRKREERRSRDSIPGGRGSGQKKP